MRSSVDKFAVADVGNNNKQCNTTMSDNSNSLIECVMFFFLIALFGGGNGFGFGNNGAGALGASALTANQTADVITARETSANVAANGTKLDAIAGIVSNNSIKTESVKDAVFQGFTRTQTDLCALGSTLGGLIRDNKDATKDVGCALSHQSERETREILAAVHAEGVATRDKMDAETRARLEAEVLALKGQISQMKQTEDIASRMGCGTPACYGTPCGGCGCSTQLQSIGVQLANLQASVNKIPTT